MAACLVIGAARRFVGRCCYLESDLPLLSRYIFFPHIPFSFALFLYILLGFLCLYFLFVCFVALPSLTDTWLPVHLWFLFTARLMTGEGLRELM